MERCAVATKEQADAEDKEQEDVNLAAVGGVHHSNNSDESDEDIHDNEASVRMDFVPRGTKTMGETEDDQQPEEEKNDDNKEMRITRLDIKSKSKMNDADLCNYFNSKLQKTEGDCGNRYCNCLKILSNRRVRSAISRYLS